jgi:serine/threonine protein kinase
MSEDSIDLIRKMLDRDLTTRPTMSQVLAHPVRFLISIDLTLVV